MFLWSDIEWSDIEQEYGINILKKVKVRDVYQLFTDNHGILCLKSYPIPDPEIRFIAQVFTHLTGSDFMYSPKILFTLSHSPWITRNKVHYMLTNWVVGQNPDFNKKNHFKKAIRILARFHSVAQGLPALNAPEARKRYSGLWERITSYGNLLAEYPKMGRLISNCNEALEHLSRPTVVKAIEQEQAVSAFVHGDFNYPNLILDTSRSIHIIDFENTSLNVRMQDFSHILHRNFPWQGKETLHWIEYYDRKRPLNVEDLHLLYTLLLVPYPVIRALQRKKREQHITIVLPTINEVRNYKNELKGLL
jgi:Ser/Thr protein kinase RdoA (MazF antagonist)